MLQPSQKTIILLSGLVPRRHTLHTADCGLRWYALRRFTGLSVLGEGLGGGTKDVGFCTARPDFVWVAVSTTSSLESLEETEAFSSSSARLRLPPRPVVVVGPPCLRGRPPPRPRPTPLARPVEVGVAVLGVPVAAGVEGAP